MENEWDPANGAKIVAHAWVKSEYRELHGRNSRSNGTQGFGKVPHTVNTLSYKPVFHEDWEHLAYSLLFLAADGLKSFQR
jgi:hypothetical protein